MNTIRHPYAWERPRMAALWQTYFGGNSSQLRRIFRLAYDREHALVLRRPGDRQIAAQLFWQDCRLAGKPAACIGGFCVRPDLQRQGLGTELLEYTHQHLKEQGCSAVVMEPQDEELFWFYHPFGYKLAGTHDSFFAKAEGKAEMIMVSPGEYHRLRREYLPENGLERPLNYFRYCSDTVAYFKGRDFVCAVQREPVPDCLELLGNRAAANGIAGYFQLPHLQFHTPGTTTQDGMLLDFCGDMPENIYLGFASE